ncbi:hypothetical protein SynA1544_01171 [Synechococcus sp. A15-44]|nr:hypothetical protein SynA1544_01171 [Synechococcus sp. A15-44]
MTARHSSLFTLRLGQSGLGIDTSQRDAACQEIKPLIVFSHQVIQ